MSKPNVSRYAVLPALLALVCLGSLAGQTLELSLDRGSAYTFQRPMLFGSLTMTPHMAAWVEDGKGNFVSTLYVSLKGGKQDFWVGSRPHPVPVWEDRHGKEEITDAIGSASPAPQAPAKLVWAARINPSTLKQGLVVWVEANIGFDYNATWPDDGKNVWGQPSVLWKAVIPPETALNQEILLVPVAQSRGTGGALTEGLAGITSADKIFSRMKIRLLP